MKKLFTLFTAMLLICGISANAQSRKTWDFTKGVSAETHAALDADKVNWSVNAVDADNVSTAWVTNANFTGELTAGGEVIPEFAGLQFSNFAATNAVLVRPAAVRLQKNCTITLPAIEAGHKVTIKAQSANATATDRGFAVTNAADDAGNTSFITLGRDAEGAPEGGVSTIELNTQGGAIEINCGVAGAPKSGIEILSIIIDEGDKNVKTWDFTNWSDATKAQVCAAEDWTKAESASKNYITGDEIRWNLVGEIIDANGDLTAGGAAIKEMMGLRHTGVGPYLYSMAFDYGTTTDGNNWGPYASPAYLWVMGANTTITIPNVKAGSTLKVTSESHKPSEARGFNPSVNGVALTSAAGANTSIEKTTFEYTIPADGDEYVDVVLKATKGCHLYSIEAEVKDENFVDKNPAIGKPKLTGIPSGKINPNTALSIAISFPNAANIEASAEVTVEGYLGPAETNEDFFFDGVTGTVGEGVSLDGILDALEENTDYEFYLTSIKVAGYDKLNVVAAEGEKLYLSTFATTGPGIKEERSWQFTTTVDDANAIADAIRAGAPYWGASSKGRYNYMNTIKYAQLMVDDNTPLRITEGLYFSMSSAKDILIGTPAHNGVDDVTSAGGNNGRLQLGGGSPVIYIPQCSAGDEVTIKVLYASSSGSKITINNGKLDDETSVIEPLQKSATEYKITVIEDGDLELISKSAVYQAISIFPAAMEKKEINYTINAVTPEGNVIAKLAEGTGVTNDKVKVMFPYYLNGDSVLYTNGARGSEFAATVTLAEEEVYGVQYKKANKPGLKKVILAVEAEDLEGVTPFSADYNTSIRASKGVAVWNEADITLCTLPAGTYKLIAGIYDATKGGGTVIQKFTAGEWTEDLISSGDNMSEVTTASDIVVTEATPLVWTAAGDASGHGMDYIVVYEYDENLIEDGIMDINALASKKNAAIYSIGGQRVNSNFRGIIIMNGKKFVK